jgi:hypothetical protein
MDEQESILNPPLWVIQRLRDLEAFARGEYRALPTLAKLWCDEQEYVRRYLLINGQVTWTSGGSHEPR